MKYPKFFLPLRGELCLDWYLDFLKDSSPLPDIATALAVFPRQILAQFFKKDLELVAVGTGSFRVNGISFMLFGFHALHTILFLI